MSLAVTSSLSKLFFHYQHNYQQNNTAFGAYVDIFLFALLYESVLIYDIDIDETFDRVTIEGLS